MTTAHSAPQRTFSTRETRARAMGVYVKCAVVRCALWVVVKVVRRTKCLIERRRRGPTADKAREVAPVKQLPITLLPANLRPLKGPHLFGETDDQAPPGLRSGSPAPPLRRRDPRLAVLRPGTRRQAAVHPAPALAGHDPALARCAGPGPGAAPRPLGSGNRPAIASQAERAELAAGCAHSAAVVCTGPARGGGTDDPAVAFPVFRRLLRIHGPASRDWRSFRNAATAALALRRCRYRVAAENPISLQSSAMGMPTAWARQPARRWRPATEAGPSAARTIMMRFSPSTGPTSSTGRPARSGASGVTRKASISRFDDPGPRPFRHGIGIPDLSRERAPFYGREIQAGGSQVSSGPF